MRTERIWSGKRFPGSKQVPWIYDHNSDTVYYGPPGTFHDPIFTHLGEKWTSGGMADLAATPMTAGAYFPQYNLAQFISGVQMPMTNISAALSASPHLSHELSTENLSTVSNGLSIAREAGSSWDRLIEQQDAVIQNIYDPQTVKRLLDEGKKIAFGYLDGQLIFGMYHEAIILGLEDKGWDYKTILDLPQQYWGWARKNPLGIVSVVHASDYFYDQTQALIPEIEEKLNQMFGNGSHLAAIALTTPEQARSRVLAGQHQSFGYIQHQLYFGPNHSNITSALINHGIYTWQSLMNAEQVWGWVRKNAAFGYPESHENGLDINFVSDDKYMENVHASDPYKREAEQALKDLILGVYRQSFGGRHWS